MIDSLFFVGLLVTIIMANLANVYRFIKV